MKTNTFTPKSTSIPSGIITNDFTLRMLSINDAAKDYDAVKSSINHLQGIFGPHNAWPADDLTLKQNQADLHRYQKEFRTGSSFAYTVMNSSETMCLGCVYIHPSEKKGYDAKVILWVRQSEIKNSLDKKLFSTVKTWLSDNWWFTKVAFPGHDQDWQEWESLPNK